MGISEKNTSQKSSIIPLVHVSIDDCAGHYALNNECAPKNDCAPKNEVLCISSYHSAVYIYTSLESVVRGRHVYKYIN